MMPVHRFCHLQNCPDEKNPDEGTKKIRVANIQNI